MRSTPTVTPPPPRRPRAAALDNDLRARLADVLTRERPEAIAVRAEVSTATVQRACAGRPVLAPMRAALARAIDCSPSTAAA